MQIGQQIQTVPIGAYVMFAWIWAMRKKTNAVIIGHVSPTSYSETLFWTERC